MTAMFIADGFQVPDMGGLLVETEGKPGGTEFRQRGPIGSNVGTIKETTSTWIVVGVEHCPVAGVKV